MKKYNLFNKYKISNENIVSLITQTSIRRLLTLLVRSLESTVGQLSIDVLPIYSTLRRLVLFTLKV